MGRLQAIRGTPDGDLGLSEISYRLMRRLALGREAKEAFGFIPKYELEVMHGMDVMRPICTFHYRDKEGETLRSIGRSYNVSAATISRLS